MEWEGPQFDVVLIVDTLHHWIVNFEPITEQQGPVCRWTIRHDRRGHTRSFADLHALFDDTGIAVMKSDEIRFGPIATRAILAVPEQFGDHKREDSDVEMHNG